MFGFWSAGHLSKLYNKSVSVLDFSPADLTRVWARLGMEYDLILKNPLIIRRHDNRKEVIKTIRMKHCPKCGSTNINFPIFYRPSIWKCLDCGYEGAFIIEDGTLAEKCKRPHEIDASSSIGWKEDPAWTIGTVKWTNGTELYCG